MTLARGRSGHKSLAAATIADGQREWSGVMGKHLLALRGQAQAIRAVRLQRALGAMWAR